MKSGLTAGTCPRVRTSMTSGRRGMGTPSVNERKTHSLSIRWGWMKEPGPIKAEPILSVSTRGWRSASNGLMQIP